MKDGRLPSTFRERGPRRSAAGALGILAVLGLEPNTAAAQQQQPPPYGGQWNWSTGQMTPMAPAPPAPSSRSRRRTNLEIGMLYATSIGYGVGLGIWLDAETGIEDPGLRLIPPAILGLAAPIGVWYLDQPRMRRGVPAAMAAGMVIGAGEGLGIAGTQFVTADDGVAWGFKGLSRSVALGATAGGVAGYAVGYYEEPSPNLSAFVTSGMFWGTAIGSTMGYGVSEAGVGYGRANDAAAIGGLIGFNVGIAATAALSTVYLPSWNQLGWMWAGAGIGAAVSLPVFLFYTGSDSPAKRGFIFTGTAILLGTVAGGIFSSGEADFVSGSPAEPEPSGYARVTYVVPLLMDGGAGVGIGGSLE